MSTDEHGGVDGGAAGTAGPSGAADPADAAGTAGISGTSGAAGTEGTSAAAGAPRTEPIRTRDAAALEAEVERLRRRNAQLESPTAVRARHAARTTVVVILTILGALCLTLAVPAVWARNQVLDTDRYVANMEPLASNPDVQASVEAAVNREIAARLDIGAFVDQALQALPPQAARLKAPIESGVSGLIGTTVHKAVTSDAFVTLWTAANRAGHTALVSLLTGENQGKAVSVSNNGAVLLNLGPIIDQVKARLVSAGLGIAQNIPTVGATIEIAQLQGVDRAQQVVRWLNTLANWLPWIGLVLLAGAVALARGRRRRALLWAALSVAIGVLLLRIALIVLREVYLDQMPTDVITPQASAYIFDTATRFLRDGIRLIFILALVVALIAVLLGQRALIGRGGRRVSKASRAGWDSLRDGPVGLAVADHAGVAAGAVVAVGALVLVLWSNPTGLVVLVIGIIVALLLAAVWALSHRSVEVGLPAG